MSPHFSDDLGSSSPQLSSQIPTKAHAAQSNGDAAQLNGHTDGNINGTYTKSLEEPVINGQHAVIPSEKASQDAPVLGTPVTEAPALEAPVRETSTEETAIEEAPIVKAAVLEASANEASTHETPTEKSPAEELPALEAAVVDPATQEAPVQDTRVLDAPAIEAPIIEAAVTEAPVVDPATQEAPVQDTRVLDAPVIEAPAVEAPVNEVVTPIQELLTQDTQIQKASTKEAATQLPTKYNPWNPIQKSTFLLPTDTTDVHDLLCVGFGPASLAIAIAMHDRLSGGSPVGPSSTPRVLFLEKQKHFAWHAGMLLPGAKMQISFLKDLASLRDPRSKFTFLNYLHENGRLIDFINLSTFLPARVEYEDYLRWCAAHFEDLVQYNHQVVAVSPEPADATGVKIFSVTCRNVKTGSVSTYRSKNVLLAVGGLPNMPRELPLSHPRIIHSSQYAQLVPEILTDRTKAYRVAVVGAGQSAAEIFSNVQGLYPNSTTHLIMRSEFLRPSDDSPFINTIFNPAFIDQIHSKPLSCRRRFLTDAKATNYSVVRLELIESIYERMYDQRRDLGPDETRWPHRIRGGYAVTSSRNSGDGLALTIAPIESEGVARDEHLEVDLVIAATGYRRDAHVEMLRGAWDLLPPVAAKEGGDVDGWVVTTGDQERRLEAGRDYSVKFEKGAVQSGSGVWLQGCCESTHGLSDTLLSVLATRSGEMVDAIFGA